MHLTLMYMHTFQCFSTILTKTNKFFHFPLLDFENVYMGTLPCFSIIGLSNILFTQISPIPFLNNPKDLDPSYKTDLDLWDCFGRKKTLSYNQRNTVYERICS